MANRCEILITQAGKSDFTGLGVYDRRFAPSIKRKPFCQVAIGGAERPSDFLAIAGESHIIFTVGGVTI
jgi:hypothetical protein